MGDRSVVAFIDNTGLVDMPEGIIYFYSHWAGREAHESVIQTIATTPGRHDDPPYLIRRCMAIVMGDDGEGETGFGIGLGSTDNEYRILVVDTVRKKVFYCDDSRNGNARTGAILRAVREESGVSFKELSEGLRPAYGKGSGGKR